MTRPSLLLRCGWAATLSVLTLSASAQFNGPSLGTGVSINQPTTLTTDKAILYPGPRDPHIHYGDAITISIFSQPSLADGLIVGTDGEVLLPFLGKVSLDGLTTNEASKLIAEKLKAAEMYKDPQVTVTITGGPNAGVTLVGEAHGIIPITGPRRLLDVLTLVGGLPGTASHVISITRPGLDHQIVGDLGTDPARSDLANIPIFPGDTIVTGKIGGVYILGAFRTPGLIPLPSNTALTLLEAISLSGGPIFEAKYNDLRIIRTSGDTRSFVKLDMKRVLYGKDSDPILQANDIIFLPSSAIKASISNGSLGTALGLFSTALSTYAFLRYAQ